MSGSHPSGDAAVTASGDHARVESRGSGRRDTLLATLCLVMLVVTAAWPDWIEELTGLDPDHGNGLVEWLVLGVLGALFAVFAVRSVRVRVRRPAKDTDGRGT